MGLLPPTKVIIPCPFTLYRNGIMYDKQYKDTHKKITQMIIKIRETKNIAYETYVNMSSYLEKEKFREIVRIDIKEDIQEIRHFAQMLLHYRLEIEYIKRYLTVYFASYKPLLLSEEENAIIEFVKQQHCSTRFEVYSNKQSCSHNDV